MRAYRGLSKDVSLHQQKWSPALQLYSTFRHQRFDWVNDSRYRGVELTDRLRCPRARIQRLATFRQLQDLVAVHQRLQALASARSRATFAMPALARYRQAGNAGRIVRRFASHASDAAISRRTWSATS
jgi:hypothetical protein